MTFSPYRKKKTFLSPLIVIAVKGAFISSGWSPLCKKDVSFKAPVKMHMLSKKKCSRFSHPKKSQRPEILLFVPL